VFVAQEASLFPLFFHFRNYFSSPPNFLHLSFVITVAIQLAEWFLEFITRDWRAGSPCASPLLAAPHSYGSRHRLGVLAMLAPSRHGLCTVTGGVRHRASYLNKGDHHARTVTPLASFAQLDPDSLPALGFRSFRSCRAAISANSAESRRFHFRSSIRRAKGRF
jgi:hypothetical protein